jgi:hypothetical protein
MEIILVELSWTAHLGWAIALGIGLVAYNRWVR